MADQRDSLLREVDEELRREQLLKLWEQYGTYIIAAAVLVIAGIGGYKYYEHRSALAAEAAGARMAIAARDVAQNRTAEAQKALDDIAATGPPGYAALARLRLAAADREAGKTAEAASAYEAIAKAAGTDPLLADYARLQAAMLRLDQCQLYGYAESAQRSGGGWQSRGVSAPGSCSGWLRRRPARPMKRARSFSGC